MSSLKMTFSARCLLYFRSSLRAIDIATLSTYSPSLSTHFTKMSTAVMTGYGSGAGKLISGNGIPTGVSIIAYLTCRSNLILTILYWNIGYDN